MTSKFMRDTMNPYTAALQADMECFRDTVAASAGGTWWKQDQMMLVTWDALEYKFAAYTPAGGLKGNPFCL